MPPVALPDEVSHDIIIVEVAFVNHIGTLFKIHL